MPMLVSQQTQVPVEREILEERDDRRNIVRSKYGADFWPMTFILIVIVVGSLVALTRIAELY